MDKKVTNNRKNAPIPLRTGVNGETSLSRDEMRSVKKKKLRRRRKIRKFILSVLFATVIAALGILLAFTVFFKIDSITVEGLTAYKSNEVIESSGVQLDDSLFFVSAKSVAAKLTKEKPYISSVSITRELPSTIIINVTETTAAATLKTDAGYILIDSGGKVLEISAKAPKKGISRIVGVNKEKATPGDLIVFDDTERGEAVLAVISAKNSVGLTGITSINMKDLSDITLVYDSRIKLKIGTVSDVKTKLKKAKAALLREDEINKYSVGTLDLRTDPYAYFSPEEKKPAKSKKSSTTQPETTATAKNS